MVNTHPAVGKNIQKPNFNFSKKRSKMAAKKEVALFSFQEWYYSIPNFILHMEKIFKNQNFIFQNKTHKKKKKKKKNPIWRPRIELL